MSQFTVHTAQSAPENSRPILEATQASMGFVPNLFGVFANSPAILEAYTTLSKIQTQSTDFSETERQVLFLSISATNNCTYCVAAHTAISKMSRVADDVVEAIREGRPLADAKLEALRTFATHLVRERGWTSPSALDDFLAAGYDQRHVLEVILAISFKTLSNFASHVSSTTLDEAFQPVAWEGVATV